MSYARQTVVSAERSKADVERLVMAFGAGQFMSAFDRKDGRAIIGWTLDGRMVRLAVPLPDPSDEKFTRRWYNGKPTARALPPDAQRRNWEQACRSRWRAILLIVRAKFEAIEAGISTVEREFLADTVMANGTTIGEWVAPQLESMYATGKMPLALPGLGKTTP